MIISFIEQNITDFTDFISEEELATEKNINQAQLEIEEKKKLFLLKYLEEAKIIVFGPEI